LGLKFGYDLVAEAIQKREAAIADRTSRKEKAERTIAAGNAAESRMNAWKTRSLPTNNQVSQANYLNWLTSIASKDLKNALIDRGNVAVEPGERPRGVVASKDKAKPLYEKYSFHIKANSDLKMTGVVKFLYDFYSANHLQKIRNLSLTPDKDKLVVSIDVEAMMLPTAERKEDLLKTPLPTLAQGDLSAYERMIGHRDLFVKGGYVAPRQEGPRIVQPAAPPFDIARYTKVTAIKSVNGEPEMDVNVRTTGQQFRGLKVGDEFQVGENSNKATYKVLEIGAYDAVLLVDGKDRKQIKLGDVLRDAVPVSETPAGL